MPRQIHQIVPTLAYGDAIGNQVLELRRLLREWGYTSEIFAERWHPKLAAECHYYEKYRRFSHPDNLLILHYSIGGEVNQYVRTLDDRVALYYHNVTPAHFLYQVNGELARQLDEARRDLAGMAGEMPAIAASPYNQQELEKLGFQVVGIAPYILTFEQLDTGLQGAKADQVRQRFGKPDTWNWLYVGRLAPNKCVQDIILAFYYYHRWIEPKSRLLLVGAGEGFEVYVRDLYRLVTRFGLDGSVLFAGHLGTADGLAAFYQMADLYVSMSEHEGFCVPLLEAMYYDVPVLTYASTGVPFTMGDAGILIHQKEPHVVAEIAHEVKSNEDFREKLLQGQHARLKDFAPDLARAQFRTCLQSLGQG